MELSWEIGFYRSNDPERAERLVALRDKCNDAIADLACPGPTCPRCGDSTETLDRAKLDRYASEAGEPQPPPGDHWHCFHCGNDSRAIHGPAYQNTVAPTDLRAVTYILGVILDELRADAERMHADDCEGICHAIRIVARYLSEANSELETLSVSSVERREPNAERDRGQPRARHGPTHQNTAAPTDDPPAEGDRHDLGGSGRRFAGGRRVTATIYRTHELRRELLEPSGDNDVVIRAQGRDATKIVVETDVHRRRLIVHVLTPWGEQLRETSWDRVTAPGVRTEVEVLTAMAGRPTSAQDRPIVAMLCAAMDLS